MLLKMFKFLTLNAGHISWRAAFLCSFRGLLRKAHVTLLDATLLRKDFSFFQWGMMLKIRKSKKIQFAERTILIPMSRCPDIRLCAVHWTELHFRQLPAPPDSPAFLVPSDDNQNTPLTYGIYQSSLKRFGGLAGLDVQQLSSHSLRRGGCTYLSLSGATLEEIRARGDWTSNAVFLYLQTPLSVRILNDMRVATMLGATSE